MDALRIALIADIHGNLPALEAVLADIGRTGVEKIVCLGDVAATGPQPRAVIARLRSLDCRVVMGNADAELFDPEPTPEPDTDHAKFAEMSRWAANQLAPDELAWLRSFQPAVRVKLPATTELLCVHGSPRSFNDPITATTPEPELAAMLGDEPAAIIAAGHTHVPLLRRHRDRLLLNPGSVGLAYAQRADGSFFVPAVAQYATLAVTPSGRQVAFHEVPYDQAATIRAMFAPGMPHAAWWAADWQWSLAQPE